MCRDLCVILEPNDLLKDFFQSPFNSVVKSQKAKPKVIPKGVLLLDGVMS